MIDDRANWVTRNGKHAIWLKQSDPAINVNGRFGEPVRSFRLPSSSDTSNTHSPLDPRYSGYPMRLFDLAAPNDKRLSFAGVPNSWASRHLDEANLTKPQALNELY
ncbi:hypothetical protein BDP27DRAFT_1436294 [Rhodocollybia butyracea]|uniref:Uncharacterized protein n=1 Tax=Rhodocollybia butyracea TaxID=206335 RepID=A0A9P5P189_9AGAR|nr:hypothetical protein BDP27DRAFT_1436294 [Rhodocollybia butyracea]